MSYFEISIEKPTHGRKQTASKAAIDWKVQKVVRNKTTLLWRFWKKLKSQPKRENEEGTKKKNPHSAVKYKCMKEQQQSFS